MRAPLLFSLLLLPLSIALAIPPVAKAAVPGPARLNNGAGVLPAPVVAAAAAGTNTPIGGEEKSLNYVSRGCGAPGRREGSEGEGEVGRQGARCFGSVGSAR